MDPYCEHEAHVTRRQFFGRSATGIGAAALASMLSPEAFASGGTITEPHFPRKAKRVIYLFQAGGPSQHELFDYKPILKDLRGTDIPPSVKGTQRITGMSGDQASFPIVPSIYDFKQYGENGLWFSSIVPHLGSVADDLCVIKTVNTEAVNHDPAITYFQTGHQQPGRPSLGAWLSYGLGSENKDLPSFIVFISHGSRNGDSQALFQRLWGAGFLPSAHQGVQFRAKGDPVLYLSNPPGVSAKARRRMLDSLASLNEIRLNEFGSPEIDTRIAQYEMAYRMQTSVPEVVSIEGEPDHVIDSYGPNARTPGTFAANCLRARRLAEKGVQFIQLYHRGWDQHGDLPDAIKQQAWDVDQPAAALIKDLKQRGMLDETLVVFAGEFGRTVFSQGTPSDTKYGRDHHGRCFSIWMAGGGIKGGITYGETDDFSYNIVKDPVHVHDVNATILRQLGIDHEKLTYRYQGRDFRLTDVHGKVVTDIIA
jgi:hypothetical protein